MSLARRIRNPLRVALLVVPLWLVPTACSSSATSFSCSVGCMDGSHHQVDINPDGGDPCEQALNSLCSGGNGTCECNSN